MQAPTAPALPHYPALDGLRGIAVLMVMVFHSQTPLLPGGFIGVDVFFVISGYLITTLLLAEHARKQRIDIRRFYVRRLLRLAPALLLMLLVFGLCSLFLLPAPQAMQNLREALAALFYVSNWVRAWGLFEMPYLGHTWSLAIEEQFYLLWPLLLLLVLRHKTQPRHIALFALGLVLWVIGYRTHLTWDAASIERLYNGLDTRIDEILVGCLLAALVRNLAPIPAKASQATAWLALLCFAALCGMAFLARWTDRWMYTVGFPLISGMTAWMVFDLCHNRRSVLRHLMTVGPLVQIGRISYGLYLWHYPIYFSMYKLQYGYWMILCLGSALALVCAMASYRFVETRFLALKPY